MTRYALTPAGLAALSEGRAAVAPQAEPPKREWWEMLGTVVHGAGCGCRTCAAKRRK